MKNSKFILTALCLVLVLGMMVSPALAYFTDYATAEGEVAIELGFKTVITEEVDGLEKAITISNPEGPEACFVRVKALAGSDVKLDYSGSGWTKSGEWYVYDSILEAGASTSVLTVSITLPAGEEGAGKNVVVVHESAKVIYNADGSPAPADWTMAANIVA